MNFLYKFSDKYYIFIPLIIVVLFIQLFSFDSVGFANDLVLLTDNQRLSDISGLFSELSRTYPGNYDYKPLTMMSLILNTVLLGDNISSYHIGNILLHILTVLAFYNLLIKIGNSKSITFVFSLIFSIHPIISSSVAIISSRSFILMTLFGIISLIYSIKYYESKKTIFIWISGIMALFSILSDFMGFSIIAISIIYAIIFYKNEVVENFNTIIAPYLSVIIIWFMLFMGLSFTSVDNLQTSDNNSFYLAGLFFDFSNILLLPQLFSNLFNPFSSSTVNFYDTISLIIGVVLMLSLLVFILFSINKKVIGLKKAAFGFSLIIMSFIFSLVSLANYNSSFYDFTNGLSYFPFFAITFLIASVLSDWFGNRTNKFLNIGYIVLVGIFAFISFFNLKDFSSELSFWESAFADYPNKKQLHNKLLDVYIRGGYDEKVQAFGDKIDASENGNLTTLLKLSDYHLSKKNYNQTILILNKVKNLDSTNKTANKILFQAYFETKEFDKAKLLLESVVNDTINYPEAKWDLFNLYLETKSFDSAEDFGVKTFISDSDVTRALLIAENWSKIFYKEKDNVSVVKSMKTALAIHPDNPVIINYLYDTYTKIGMKEKAREYEQRLMKIFKEQVEGKE